MLVFFLVKRINHVSRVGMYCLNEGKLKRDDFLLDKIQMSNN